MKDRVFFIRTANIPDIFNNVDGVVTINSTVGLKALFHEVPVFCLGNSIYIKKGLAESKNLQYFIKEPGKYKPVSHIVSYFKIFIKNNTQLQGSFY
jgi:capsular polysaccharide export protein